MMLSRDYVCTDIDADDKSKNIISCLVSVPVVDLSDAVGRQENLAAISGALESILGPVESFSYKEYQV